jgi:hypothetical protein
MRYIILLPILSSASAFLSSHLNHSECIERCNGRPFKVAIEARRAECKKSCAPNRHSDGSSQTEDRVATCISHCNAQKGSERFKSSCRSRCPKLYDTAENDNNSKDEETKTSVSQNDANANVDNDPVSYLPVEKLASVPAPKENTSIALMGPNINSTQGTVNASSTVLYPGSTHIQEIDHMSDVKNATDNVLNVPEELRLPFNSSASVFQSISDNNGGKLKALFYGSNRSRTLAMAPKGETVVSNNMSTPAPNKTSSINGTITGHKTEFSNLSATPSLNEPSALHAAPAPSVGVVGSNQNASQPVYVATQVLVDSPLSLDANQECIAKCNEKRTLKRKKDACIKRCESNAPSSSTSLLKRGYNSAKFEL